MYETNHLVTQNVKCIQISLKRRFSCNEFRASSAMPIFRIQFNIFYREVKIIYVCGHEIIRFVLFTYKLLNRFFLTFFFCAFITRADIDRIHSLRRDAYWFQRGE